ncbi:MAG TPA: hypothetical protein VGO49_14950 [Bradyrhizobium sp.]|jgi:hypothetical protein|nr:hypothetical protein [Bradyrhizobium sp.]
MRRKPTTTTPPRTTPPLLVPSRRLEAAVEKELRKVESLRGEFGRPEQS